MVMGTERLFLQALFRWGEFQDTIKVGRLLLGDPNSLTANQLQDWLMKPARIELMPFWETLWDRFSGYPLHSEPSFDLFIIACCHTWIDIEGERKSVSTNLEATYLLAHRSTEWLGIRSFEQTPYCWVYAFFGGNLNPYQPWPAPVQRIKKRLANKPDFSEFRSVLEEINPREIDVDGTEIKALLDGLLGYPPFKNKYPEFGPRDISLHRHKESNSTLKTKRVDKASVLAHPLYSLAHLAKFRGMTPWTVVESRTTDATVNACLEGRISVEELLCEEIVGSPYIVSDLETVFEEKGESAFWADFRSVANRVYRAVHGRFARRGHSMPTPPKGWRQRCFKKVSNYIDQREKAKGIVKKQVNKLERRRYIY